MTSKHVIPTIGRRAFIQGGAIVIAASATMRSRMAVAGPLSEGVRVGMVTDMHYADKSPAGTRHYRETLDKLADAASTFEDQRLDFIVELGDLIDAAEEVDVERRYLKVIQEKFAAIHPHRHYVLGNHCVDTLTKEEFLGGVEQAESYYAFTQGNVRFLILDACFRSDGVPYGRRNAHWTDANIAPAELEWLADELENSTEPVIVFAHQRLDVQNEHGVRNAVAVRSLLEKSERVLAVFQGHSHQNDLKEINDIPYCTLAAMVEGSGADNNGYALLNIDPSGTIRLTGYRRQASYELKA